MGMTLLEINITSNAEFVWNATTPKYYEVQHSITFTVQKILHKQKYLTDQRFEIHIQIHKCKKCVH